jgi:thiamine monophosphate kinase
MRLACERIGVELIGGDTSASITVLAISITMLGTVAKDKITYRSGAKQNDLICVTGDLGAAYAGIGKYFQRGKGPCTIVAKVRSQNFQAMILRCNEYSSPNLATIL